MPTVRPLIDAITDPLVLVEGARILALNVAARELLGDASVGRQVAACLPPLVVRALEHGPATPPTLVAEVGAERRHWEIRIGTVDENRRLVHLIDRTAVQAVEKMRVDFVANASHELRTPIAAITGFVETLEEDDVGGDPATRRHFLQVIARETRRMQRLVEDLMSLSRIEADQHVAPTDRIDLATIASEAALAAAEQRAPRTGDLVLGTIERPLTVCGDAPQIAQLAHNLVSNGFKYSVAGQPVSVSLRAVDGMAQLVVADQGEGIAPEHLSRVTQRFYRVNVPRSRAIGGTGLGLSIVKHIVERHGGQLDIASQPGIGTTVTVALPLAAPGESSK